MPVTTCAAIRVGSNVSPSSRRELPVGPGVGGDHREERGADGDEHVGAEPGFALTELPLEADRAAERGREGHAKEDVDPGERQATGASDGVALRSRDLARSRPRRGRASRRAGSREKRSPSAVAWTSISRPSPAHDDVDVDLGASSPPRSRGRAAARRRRSRPRPRRPSPSACARARSGRGPGAPRRTRPRSRRTASRRRPGARRSRARASARRAPRGR